MQVIHWQLCRTILTFTQVLIPPRPKAAITQRNIPSRSAKSKLEPIKVDYNIKEASVASTGYEGIPMKEEGKVWDLDELVNKEGFTIVEAPPNT